MADMIWKIVLGGSLFGLLVMIPATVGAYRDAVSVGDTPRHLPKRQEVKPAYRPVAKLTGREYRRILRETEAYKKAARARRSPR